MNAFVSRPLSSIETYMYGLKSRAHLDHCHGNAMFPAELTELAAARRQYCRQIRPVTLIPFFVKAVALAIRAHPGARRILFKRFPFGRRMVQFDAVDVNIPVTRDVDGEQRTFVGIIRNADTLTIAEIQDELLRIQRDPPEESPYLQKLTKLEKAPPIVASLYHWLMSRSPAFYLKNAGTCGVIPLERMPGSHFFPIGPTTAMFGIGGIGDQVVARDGIPVVRRMLQISLSLDNYVMTGPEGLALSLTFQQLLESCGFVRSELDAVPCDPVQRTA